MRRWMLATIATVGLFGFSSTAQEAAACPLCKLANESKQATEEENLRPKAYMYSILFMLSMPFSLTAAFSYGFYRAWKKGQADQDQSQMDELLNNG